MEPQESRRQPTTLARFCQRKRVFCWRFSFSLKLNREHLQWKLVTVPIGTTGSTKAPGISISPDLRSHSGCRIYSSLNGYSTCSTAHNPGIHANGIFNQCMAHCPNIVSTSARSRGQQQQPHHRRPPPPPPPPPTQPPSASQNHHDCDCDRDYFFKRHQCQCC